MDTVRGFDFHIQQVKNKGNDKYFSVLHRYAYNLLLCSLYLKGRLFTVFIIGWTVFALLSPIMAYFTWMTKEKGIFPKIISIGIIVVSLLSSVVLFDRIRFYDIIISGIMAYFLFVKKIER